LNKAIGSKTTPQAIQMPWAGAQAVSQYKPPVATPKPTQVQPKPTQLSTPVAQVSPKPTQVQPQSVQAPQSIQPQAPVQTPIQQTVPQQQQNYTPNATNYAQAQQNLQQSGQATPMEQEYIQRIQNAQAQQNIGKLAPYAESGMWTGTPEPSTELLTRPDLAGRGTSNQGIYNNLANIYGSQATAGLQAANTIAGRGQTAAQGLLTSTMPQTVAPGTSLISPTGQNLYGGSAGTTDLTSLAQGVISGQLSPSQAEAQISYNPLLKSQLYQSIQQLSPGFSYPTAEQNITAQGTALGQNVTTGRAIQLASTSANQALDALQTAYQSLGMLSSTGIPLLNQISQKTAMTTGVGRQSTSQYLGALAEARSQVRTVLGQAGVNPVDAGQISDSLLPDNMTPGEIPNKIAAAKSYIQNRVSGFTTTGNVPQNPQQGQTPTNTNAFSQSAIWGNQ